MNKIFTCLLLFLGVMATLSVKAQVQNPFSPGFDQTATDTASSSFSDDLYEDDKATKQEPESPFLKPYERIILTFDSTTNLITFSGVIEQDESGSDSLYIRTKRWAEKKFGKGLTYELDKRNQKLVMKLVLPAYAYKNSYSRRSIGNYEFRMSVLVKEGRYKYILNNFVHETLKPASGGKPTRNYFEYYYTSENNIQINDRILRYANHDINKLIRDFNLAMREPLLVDEDEW